MDPGLRRVARTRIFFVAGLGLALGLAACVGRAKRAPIDAGASPSDAGAGQALAIEVIAAPRDLDAGSKGAAITGLAELASLKGRGDDLFGHVVRATEGELFVATPLAGDGNLAVYAPTDGGWKRSAVLHASPQRGSSQFGDALSIDGDTLAVSATEDGQAGKSAGAVYVFERKGGAWKQTAKLLPSEPTYQFGWSVALSGDTVVVGSPWDAGRAHRGAVFVFERSGGRWKQTAKLVAPTRGTQDLFGYTVAVAGDRIAVGTLGETGGPESSGAAYVFERGADKPWALVAKLVSSDRAAKDSFGNDVALIDDAVFVSAPVHVGGNSSPGAVYVFRRGPSGFVQTQKLTGSPARSFDYFGDSLSARGRELAISALGSGNAGIYAYADGKLVEEASVEPERGIGYAVGLGPKHLLVTQDRGGMFVVRSYAIAR